MLDKSEKTAIITTVMNGEDESSSGARPRLRRRPEPKNREGSSPAKKNQKGVLIMVAYDRDLFETEQRLLKEIGQMKKFSFKKLAKIIELNALVNNR